MSSSQKTEYMGLNNWLGTDRPQRIDFVDDNQKIDNNDSKEKRVYNRPERRNATSSEKSFARMVKGIAKDMLNKTNSNKLDFVNYLKCVVSLFDVYNKFMIRENVIDMFNEREVIDTEFNLINELTSKFEYDIDNETKENVQRHDGCL